ncbi:hypothetical protein JHK86_018295 [Glycine max]|nr:hypothetical protein JHK86_018295 [Glycine max]
MGKEMEKGICKRVNKEEGPKFLKEVMKLDAKGINPVEESSGAVCYDEESSLFAVPPGPLSSVESTSDANIISSGESMSGSGSSSSSGKSGASIAGSGGNSSGSSSRSSSEDDTFIN